ncbi:MAG: bifunctional diguanylate cyclase/phosphodiesterase [Arcobacteraceae bacterium]
MNKNSITNKKLIFRIIFSLFAVGLIIIFSSSFYLKNSALDQLAKDDAKKTSALIFEIMNTKMQDGWAKEDLKKILTRLEFIREGLSVHSYRSSLVEDILGVDKTDSQLVKKDIFIQKAMIGEEQFIVQKDGSIRYLYPIYVKQECITCHYNAKIGDINGVLDITYPPSEIKISLNDLTFWFIVFFIAFLLLFFYIFFLVINNKIINPIVLFTENIKQLTQEKDLNKQANIETNIEELQTLQNSFNELICTIKFYYDKQLNNLFMDNLTSLPNINRLQEDLTLHKTATLAIVNIDSFREFNNFYGIEVGDFVIKQLAQKLQEQLNKDAILYRLFGDEFAILFTQDTSIKECTTLIKNIHENEFQYKKTKFFIQVTMGIVFNNEDKRVEKAIIAVKNAKKNRKHLGLFAESLLLQNQYEKHIKWTKNLKEALDKNDIVPFYQPIKDVKTNAILKYEALARLYYKECYIAPIEFLEVSKKAKLYHRITTIMMKKTFEHFSTRPHIEFSINYSIEDILNFETTQLLFELLENYNMGHQLIIELLETEEINNFELLNNFITRLKKYKVRVAIDDFGSGYSNFSYIINMNVDYLKIDSSLIENIHVCQNSLKVVKTIISFAKEIELKTIAEKVHSKEIEDILIALEVDYVQGYHIGKPALEILE